MTYCPKCGEKIEEGSNFCQSCGASIEKKMTTGAIPKAGMLSRFEQGIYFRIARGFTWVILFVTTISLIYYMISLGPTALDLLGGETKVSQDDIRKAIEAEKARRPFTFEERVQEKIDPVLMASLDKEIYELFLLLPPDTQEKWGVERFRNEIKSTVNYGKKIKDKIAIIKEAKVVLNDFPNAERMKAIEKFFRIKAEKEMAVENKKAEAKKRLLQNSLYILSGVVFITMLSMILVLLAIERNTREGVERSL